MLEYIRYFLVKNLDFHPETWNCSLGVEQVLLGLLYFFVFHSFVYSQKRWKQQVQRLNQRVRD